MTTTDAIQLPRTFNRVSNDASRDQLNPLASPGRRLESIREILRRVHDLTVA